MAGKKTSEKKSNMVKVNLAEIDRKRMEYRWGMESFFRNHEIEADNYKEALERYRESCLVFMPEKDIKKIKDTKKIKIKRIPFINLHKIRREKPLGRWMASACFKNCGIRENRYKKELEAYHQACRLQMKPEEIAAIAEKLPCDVSDFSNSENIVYLLEIRNKMNEKTLKELFDKCGIDIKKYKNELYKQACAMQKNPEEIKKNAEKVQTILKKLEDAQKKLNLLNVDISDKKPIEDLFVECETEVNEYEDEIYKQAIILKMEPEELKVIAEKLPCSVSKFAFSDEIVDLSEIRRRLEETALKELFDKCEIDIKKYEDELYNKAGKRKVLRVKMAPKDIENIAEKLQCEAAQISNSENVVDLVEIKQKIAFKEVCSECEIDIKKYAHKLYNKNNSSELKKVKMYLKDIKKIAEKLQCEATQISNDKKEVDLSEVNKRFKPDILKEIFAEYGIDIHKYEEEILKEDPKCNMNFREVEGIEKELQWKKEEFSEFINSEYEVNLLEVKHKTEETVLKRLFAKCKMDTDEYAQAIAAYEKSGLIKVEKADIDKMERHMQLQKERFIKNAVDLSDIQCRLKVHKPGDIKQNLKDCGIEIQNYEEKLKTYKDASYLIMEEDDIEKLAKSLQCKRKEIDIKQNQVNLLQIEEKIEKIAREKWSTLEGFFASIGVKKNYQKKIEQYENKYFIECNKNLFDKLVEGFKCGEEDLLFEDNKDGNKEIYKVKIVELERRKKTKDGEWKESLYDTLKVKKILDGVNKEESDKIKEAIKKFAKASSINISQDDCEKISNSTNSEITEIIDGRVTVDRRNIPGLGIDNTDNPTKKSGLTSWFKAENSGLSNKLKEAVETGTNCFEMNLSTANQIAQISGYKLEDLQASDVDVAKDKIKKVLIPFLPQTKLQILSSLCIPELDLLIQESEKRDRENSRIEYLKTEEGYNVTIYFNGEEYEMGDIPKTNQEDDIEGYLKHEILEWLNEEELDEETLNELAGLTIVNVEEDKDYKPFFVEKCRQLLNRMDVYGEEQDEEKKKEKRLRVIQNENPFTQEMCDYYEVPNPFNIEE